MRMVIRAFALLLLVGTLGLWGAFGGTLGWTKTSVAVERIDPVTEIQFVEYEKRFVPGIEFLAVGVGGAVLIFAATLFVRISPKKEP